MTKLTRDKFELRWGKFVLSIAVIRAMGRIAVPCSCGDKICQGWQMLPDVRGLFDSEIEEIPEPYRSEAFELRESLPTNKTKELAMSHDGMQDES